MCHSSSRLYFTAMLFWPACATTADAEPARKCFAHPAVEDRDGVIAPWFATSIRIGDRPVAADMDIAATAGGLGKAVDQVVNDVRPQHGAIAIRLHGAASSVAMIQAIEVGPGQSAAGAKPVAFPFARD